MSSTRKFSVHQQHSDKMAKKQNKNRAELHQPTSGNTNTTNKSPRKCSKQTVAAATRSSPRNKTPEARSTPPKSSDASVGAQRAKSVQESPRKKQAVDYCTTPQKSNMLGAQQNTSVPQSPGLGPGGTPGTPGGTPSNHSRRELKKLTDYWSRQSPLVENSPRLRSNRKALFDIKECLRKTPKSTPVQKRGRSQDDQASNVTSENLPESPFPATCPGSRSPSMQRKYPEINESVGQTTTALSNAKVVTTGSGKDVIATPSKKLTRQRGNSDKGVTKSNEKEITSLKCDVSEVRTGYQSSNNEENITMATGSDSPLAGSSLAGDVNDSDDEDYIPPRKKLRSEVTKDELWEGIPLTVTFKRLTPRVKTESATPTVCMTTAEQCQESKRGSQGTESNESETVGPNSVRKDTSDFNEKKVAFGNDVFNEFSDREININQREIYAQNYEKLQLESCPKEEIAEAPADDDDNYQEQSLPRLGRADALPSCLQGRQTNLFISSIPSQAFISIEASAGGRSDVPQNNTDAGNIELVSVGNNIADEKYCSVTVKQLPNVSITASLSPAEPSSIKNHEAFGEDGQTVCSANSTDTIMPNFSRTISILEAASPDESRPNISGVIESSLPADYMEMDDGNAVDDCEDRESQLSESVSTTLEQIFNLDDADTPLPPKSLPPPIATTTTTTATTTAAIPGRDTEMDQNVGLVASKPDLTPRRSKRLSEHAAEQKRVSETLEQYSNEIETTAEIIGEQYEREGQELGQVSENSKSSSLQKIKQIFSKNSSVPKTIPPLRIKLKVPLKASRNNPDITSSKSSRGYTAMTSSKASRDCPDMTSLKASRDCPDVTSSKSHAIVEHEKSSKKKSKKSKVKPPPADVAGDSSVTRNADGESSFTTSGSDLSSATKKKSKKKQKAEKAGVSKWSPSGGAGVELRLTSARRRSGAADLLNNPVLNTHACVLWSSENRRHVQLFHPDASLSDLDAILSRKWDALVDKEKLRYFLRAKDAVKDENRHSNRAGNDAKRRYGDQDDASSSGPETGWSRERFDRLAPGAQMAEIKRWLHYYHEVAPEIYSGIMKEFKARMLEERIEKVETEEKLLRTTQKHRRSKLRKKDKRNSTGNDVKHRQLLFGMILAKREAVIAKLMRKKQLQKEALLTAFRSLVERLTSGDVIDFHGDVTSDNLTERLSHIRELEREGKLAVVGDVTGSPKFDTILTQLYEAGSRSTVTSGQTAEDMPGASDLDVDVLNPSISQENLPCLSPSTVRNLLSPTSGFSQDTLSDASPEPVPTPLPSAILTQWVTDDILHVNPHIGFRTAVSLLSGDKIVQRPGAPLAANASRRVTP